MKKILNSRKIFKLIMIVFLVYCFTILVKQQVKLNSYNTEQKYYELKNRFFRK